MVGLLTEALLRSLPARNDRLQEDRVLVVDVRLRAERYGQTRRRPRRHASSCRLTKILGPSIVRHQTKGLAAFEPVDGEVRSVGREYGRAIELFGQRDERGIRK